MNYSQADAKAKELINIRKIDHVIAFDGVSYSVEIKRRFKGTITKVIKYKFVNPKSDVKNSEPIKPSKKKGAKTKVVRKPIGTSDN